MKTKNLYLFKDYTSGLGSQSSLKSKSMQTDSYGSLALSKKDVYVSYSIQQLLFQEFKSSCIDTETLNSIKNIEQKTLKILQSLWA